MRPVFRSGVPGLIPGAWIVAPSRGSDAPPVVAIHGITRGSREMADLLASRARATGRTVVLPHFSRAEWPRYQRAVCEHRADLALLRLMEALRVEDRAAPGAFDLAGFSGGAQFAHRFAWTYPDLVDRLCVAAPGWWTFPDARAAWPEGMGGGRDPAQAFRLLANLRAFLDRRIVVCVGSDDVARDRNLRRGPRIDARQGPTRLMRAQNWVAAAEARAHALALDPRVSLRVLQGCGHDFADCVAHAALERDFIAPAARRTAHLTELRHERNAA